MHLSADDAESQTRYAAFLQGLQELGWAGRRNLRMDIRWTASDISLTRMYAKEFVDQRPDAILADSTPVTAALQRETGIDSRADEVDHLRQSTSIREEAS
jgi:hypothetical protein